MKMKHLKNINLGGVVEIDGATNIKTLFIPSIISNVIVSLSLHANILVETDKFIKST